MFFIDNSAICENAYKLWWANAEEEPTRDDDDIGHQSHTEFMQSFNTTMLDPIDTVDELRRARKRKLKKVANKTTAIKNIVSRDISHAWNHLKKLPNPW